MRSSGSWPSCSRGRERGCCWRGLCCFSSCRWSTSAAAMACSCASAARDTPDAIATWNGFATSFGVRPPPTSPPRPIAMRGTWADAGRMAPGPRAQPVLLRLASRPADAGGCCWGWRPIGRECSTAGGTVPASSAGRSPAWGCRSRLMPCLACARSAAASTSRFVYFGSIVASEPFRMIGVSAMPRWRCC